MRKLLLLLLSIISLQIFAGNWVGTTSGKSVPASVSLVSSDASQTTISITIEGYSLQTVQTPRGEASILNCENTSPLLQAGAPDLRKFTASFIIPDKAKTDYMIIASEYKDYFNIEIAPSKGNLYRNIDPASVLYTYGKEYTIDAFYPGRLVAQGNPYILRNFRGQAIDVYPFQYNPVTKVLRVYTHLEIKIFATNEEGTNPFIGSKNLRHSNTEFDAIYQSTFLNAPANNYTDVEEQGSMLIISYGSFMTAMQPLIDWKNQQGIACEIVDVATIGNANAIKDYITNYYNTHNLTYVLLVGDAAQVPTLNASGGSSDNSYSYIVGNDHYPDLFVGRFSAENIQQVETQVQKVLNYEKNPLTTIDWFSQGVGIASSQGPGDDNEYDWQHIRNIRTKLLDYTYTSVAELYDGSQGGFDAPGNPTSAMVATEINTGRGIINYTGHGSETNWTTTGFSNTNVNALANDNMLPFIISVACVNGKFAGLTCFAEVWLRAQHNGQPSGAVAALMSTINQSWDPPMDGQDAMNEILTEMIPGNVKRTFGGITMNGCILMNDEYGADGMEMTDTWNIFGDPSLMVRTQMPTAITATHPSTVPVGTSQIAVNASTGSGLVALTINNQIIATANLSLGSANLNFPALTETGTIHIVITAFNRIPYITDIAVVNSEPANIIFNKFTINDGNGNNNGQPDYNENIFLSVTLENTGGSPANNLTSILSCNDTYVTITDNSELYGTIAAGQQSTPADGFAFTIANNIPDQHKLNFTITTTDGITEWMSDFFMNANAPVLSVNNLLVNDVAGNNNGRLDAGEIAQMNVSISNQGHSDASSLTVLLSTLNTYVSIVNSSVNILQLSAGETSEAQFAVQANPEVPINGYAIFNGEVQCAGYQVDKNFSIPFAWHVENFESGDFSQFNWQQGGNADWTISPSSAFEGGFCAKSGIISNDQTSELLLQYYVENPDSILFYSKTSSENADYLKFYIDDLQKGQWGGENDWNKKVFAIEAGVHTFKWVYAKNSGGTQGSDAVWIDLVRLPEDVMPSASAGDDAEICELVTYTLSGSANAYVSLHWTTSGTGTFDNPNILQPEYTPGDSDIENGSVTLTLTA
ncbi:MAG: C25 family cysteine peptidase, partial [Lentimicrobiaceae bacterium]|nr:C25 family cysteine peptidase [Lentimicrobiaceae bacterium]